MATPAVNPFLMRDCTFVVDSDNYEAHVSQVEFVPTSSVVSWKGLTPTSVFSKTSASTWVCNLSYAQDWATADALSRYLLENEGSEVTAVFTPVSGSGDTITATIQIAPGSIGGAVDTVAVGSVSLGVSGKPALSAVA